MRWWRYGLLSTLLALALPAGLSVTTQAGASYPAQGAMSWINCAWSPICTEVQDPSEAFPGVPYVGHDEPSLLFYSNQTGAGNHMEYTLTLPRDSRIAPEQDGGGGTANFELHPAFWFGMAVCATQSYPLYTDTCARDSDSNIANDSNPNLPTFIGKHPGTAFMEMQFYPPGWAPFELPGGISCDPTKWCAALNIDSYAENPATNELLNPTCAARVGVEYVNFAFITRSGRSQAPANPVDSTAATYTPDPSKDLFMGSGDKITVRMHDTEQGLEIRLNDLTTGQSGSMTSSAANGFGQVQFAATGSSCVNLPYDFHPMYSTSSPDTRVPWAAHSYNIAFADEIGHFDLCSRINTKTATCTGKEGVAGVNQGPADGDDSLCLPASAALNPYDAVTGCAGTNTPGFDGLPYLTGRWPDGTARTPTPIEFTSPLTGRDYDDPYTDAAFEADMPRIEAPDFGGDCVRRGPAMGTNCTNPPIADNGKPAAFYPIFTDDTSVAPCVWQLGSAANPGATATFGGNSTAEYGTGVYTLLYQYPGNPVDTVLTFEDYHHDLGGVPC